MSEIEIYATVGACWRFRSSQFRHTFTIPLNTRLEECKTDNLRARVKALPRRFTRAEQTPVAIAAKVCDWISSLVNRILRQGNKHVTLQLLWEEYRQSQPGGYRYSRFCELYQRWRRTQDLVLRQDHRAGEKIFVDWAGTTVPIYDRKTAEVRPASLFLAVLGASSYTFAHAALRQDLPNWIECHILAFEFFQGTSQLVVPDNPRTGVTRACRYEPDLNRTYLEMAQFYNVAIMPARPYKPRDKACVSYCTSSLFCNSESWLLRGASSMAFRDRAFVQRFIETTLGIVVTMLLKAECDAQLEGLQARGTCSLIKDGILSSDARATSPPLIVASAVVAQK